MRIWFALAALAAMGTFSQPAFADMTIKSQDGSLELALPNGWHEGKAQGRLAKLVAVDGKGSRVVVRTLPKEDFKDAAAVANFALAKLKLTDSEAAKTEDAQVGGKPALRMSVMGTQSTGLREGIVVTVFEADGMYIEITASTDAAGFTKQAPVLAGFANQLKITPTAPTATPTPTPTPTNTPPGKQPPKG